MNRRYSLLAIGVYAEQKRINHIARIFKTMYQFSVVSVTFSNTREPYIHSAQEKCDLLLTGISSIFRESSQAISVFRLSLRGVRTEVGQAAVGRLEHRGILERTRLVLAERMDYGTPKFKHLEVMPVLGKSFEYETALAIMRLLLDVTEEPDDAGRHCPC